jgi:transposase-like protein
MVTEFKNIIDLLTTFDTEAKCSQYIALKRWGENPVCPHCSSDKKVYRFKDGIYFKCGVCRKKFTVRIGTIFGDSKIPLVKWFAAMWLFTSHKKGISSCQLAKEISVSQKTSWFMLHRLRYGMETPEYKAPLDGVVEADETFWGGKEKNKHQNRLPQDGLGAQMGKGEKTPIFGLVARGGEARLRYVRNTKKAVLEPVIIANVKEFARVITDEWYAYNTLNEKNYNHDTIKHAIKQYVRGDIHTNTIENVWSTLKWVLVGSYRVVSKKHLQAYLEEFAYRFNSRDINSPQRFDRMIKQSGRGSLPYQTLIAK